MKTAKTAFLGWNRQVVKFTTWKEKVVKLPDRLAAKVWIRTNQAARRNLTDDQRAMNAAGLVKLLSEQAIQEQRKAAVHSREVKAGRRKPIESDNVSEPIAKPKRDTRATVAKQQNIPERKVRAAMIWIRQNQAARRNLTDDQRGINAYHLKKLLTEQEKQDRAKARGKAGGVGRPKGNSLQAAAAHKLSKPKRDSRAQGSQRHEVWPKAESLLADRSGPQGQTERDEPRDKGRQT